MSAPGVRRWNGLLTSRPLPGHDRALDGLSDAERVAIVGSWIARRAAERRAADIFELIAASARELEMAPELCTIAVRAIDDEMRHAEICHRVAEAYAGQSLPEPARLSFAPPLHRGATEAMSRTLWVVQQCALNETTASAFLDACLAQATSALAHAALRELLSDEVDHARLGWAHLASLSRDTRAALAPYLMPIVAANVREWRRAGVDRPSDRVAAHGLISAADVARAVDEAQRSLVIPGLARVGFEVRALEQWAARGCPTAPREQS